MIKSAFFRLFDVNAVSQRKAALQARNILQYGSKFIKGRRQHRATIDEARWRLHFASVFRCRSAIMLAALPSFSCEMSHSSLAL